VRLEVDDNFDDSAHVPSKSNKGIVTAFRHKNDAIEGRNPLWLYKFQNTFFRAEFVENETFNGQRIYKITRDVSIAL
jgi:hypothetical protein